MSVLVNSGRTIMAMAVAAQPLHLAWGTGDPAWDTTPVPPPLDATALVGEVGRRAVQVVGYCTPDPAGDIVVTTGRFQSSAEPTPHLYLFTRFDFGDAPDATIREIGVFVGTVPLAGVPTGQAYVTPAELAAPGRLLILERRAVRIIRSGDTREAFEHVITF